MPNPEMQAVCEHCDSAGAIVDLENPSVGVVCAGCGGKGYRTVTLKKFTGRKTLKGIKHVRWSGAGLVPFSSRRRPIVKITYAEFRKGKLP